MKIERAIAVMTLSSILALPMRALGQETEREREHERAVAAQRASDHRHHTGAKIVVGSAAGGAVVGGLRGGPVGAVVGAGVGAAGGAVVNKVRVHHDVKKRVRREETYSR